MGRELIIMGKNVDYLQKIYERNPITGNYIIEVALDKYTDVFNDWDYASYKKRDMDPELAYFLEDCADDIPGKYGLDICFYIPKEIKDKRREEVIVVGIKTYYSFYLHSELKVLRATYKRIFLYILTSFLILLTKMFLVSVSKPTVLFNTISESMNIGGWVFLWEALSLVFINRSDSIENTEKYKRFVNSNIYFKYNEDKQDIK